MRFIDRFKSENGLRLLVDALLGQAIVAGDRLIAEEFAGICALEEYGVGAKIIEQGNSDNDILFIIGGSVSILVNGREVNTRGACQHIGEMALIDPTARRMATVVAQEIVTVARVSESNFSKIANNHPTLWRSLAIQMATRLRQRSKFIKEANSQPHIFIGSSRESLGIAKKIQDGLMSEPISVYVWTDNIFTASKTAIEALEDELLKADFAVLVLSDDDKVFSRGHDADAPRDNVIFELGLFMGALTRGRTFFVRPKDKDIKIPSDLLGVTPLTYQSSDDLADNVCTAIRSLVRKAGPK